MANTQAFVNFHQVKSLEKGVVVPNFHRPSPDFTTHQGKRIPREIEDFVVQKKKDSPELSHRGIARRVEEKFGRRIGQSAVGIVLKRRAQAVSVSSSLPSEPHVRALGFFALLLRTRLELPRPDQGWRNQGRLSWSLAGVSDDQFATLSPEEKDAVREWDTVHLRPEQSEYFKLLKQHLNAHVSWKVYEDLKVAFAEYAKSSERLLLHAWTACKNAPVENGRKLSQWDAVNALAPWVTWAGKAPARFAPEGVALCQRTYGLALQTKDVVGAIGSFYPPPASPSELSKIRSAAPHDFRLLPTSSSGVLRDMVNDSATRETMFIWRDQLFKTALYLAAWDAALPSELVLRKKIAAGRCEAC